MRRRGGPTWVGLRHCEDLLRAQVHLVMLAGVLLKLRHERLIIVGADDKTAIAFERSSWP